jgi:ribosomal protein S27AE
VILGVIYEGCDGREAAVPVKNACPNCGSTILPKDAAGKKCGKCGASWKNPLLAHAFDSIGR